jgi:hypothetical protein
MHIVHDSTSTLTAIDAPDAKASILALLEDILPTVYESIHYGHDLFSKRHLEHIPEWTKTTRSNVIRDYVVNRADELMVSNPRVRFVDLRGMHLLVVDDKVAIRFKKLVRRKTYPGFGKGTLDTSNIPTRQVGHWKQGTLGIPGLRVPLLTCIDVGYENDVIGTGIQTVWAVARGTEPWYFNMTADYSGQLTRNLFSSEEELPHDSPFVIKPGFGKSKNDEQQAGV